MHNGGIKYKKPPISWAHCGRWYVSSVEASGIAQSGGVALQAANWRLAWWAAPPPAYRASQKFRKFAELLLVLCQYIPSFLWETHARRLL
jgi:hypothetical protein